MEYNDLMILAKKRKILQKDLCKQLDFTPAGFKRGIENGTFPINKVAPLCQALGITPNELIGWDAVVPVSGNYASHITGGNTQNSNEAIEVLAEQLREKDRQINKLLKLCTGDPGQKRVKKQ